MAMRGLTGGIAAGGTLMAGTLGAMKNTTIGGVKSR